MTTSPPSEASAHADARVALQNAGWVVAQRGLQLLVGVLFAILVPRLMGPAVFGQYALVISVSSWFALLTGVGAASMMTRWVPGLVLRDDQGALRKLLSSLLALRAGTGLLAAAAYLLLTTAWLGGVDVMALAFVAGAVCCRTISNICFAFFLGLNQAARWGLGELLRRSLALPLVMAGFVADGLRGACAGFFAAQALVMLAGLWMSRRYFHWPSLWPDLRFLLPYLRTGAYFAGGNLLFSLSQRTGETLVQLFTRDFREVGYFGATYGMYTAGAEALWFLALAFAPILVAWRERGDEEAVRKWLERLQTWMTIASVSAAITVLFVGEQAVGLLLGRAYVPAAQNLLPLTFGLVVVAISSVSRLQAIVVDRPGMAATGAALQLATFWGLGSVLVPLQGSFGACLAVVAGAGANAAYLAWRLHDALPFSRRAAVRTVVLALAVVPLAWLRTSSALDAGLLLVVLAAFVGLLLRLRIAAVGEITALWRSLRTGARAPSNRLG